MDSKNYIATIALGLVHQAMHFCTLPMPCQPVDHPACHEMMLILSKVSSANTTPQANQMNVFHHQHQPSVAIRIISLGCTCHYKFQTSKDHNLLIVNLIACLTIAPYTWTDSLWHRVWSLTLVNDIFSSIRSSHPISICSDVSMDAVNTATVPRQFTATETSGRANTLSLDTAMVCTQAKLKPLAY